MGIGIAALCNTGRLDEPSPILNQMVEVLGLKSSERVETIADHGVKVFAGARRGAVSESSDPRARLILLGEIHDLGQHGGGPLPCEPGNPASVLLNRYLSFGVKAVCGLNGQYLVAIWEPQPKRLTFVNDRYGLQKLYYWSSGPSFMAASRLAALCCHSGMPATLDDQSLAEFLAFGHMLDDRTWFDAAKLMPPASTLEFESGRVSIRTYWEWEFGISSGGTGGDYVDGFASHFDSAVKRCAGEDHEVVVPVSGGLDSRSIVGTLRRHRANFATLTYGHSHCRDVRYGRRIAAAVGSQHQTLPLEPNYMAEFTDHGVRLTDGMVTCHNFHLIALLGHIRNAPVVLSGFAGGPVAGGELGPATGLYGVRTQDPDAAFPALYRKFYARGFGERELAAVLRPEVHRRIRRGAFAALQDSFARVKGATTYDRWYGLEVYQRTRRLISYQLDLLATVARVRAPFLDNDLVDFLQTVPVEHRQGKGLIREMLRRYHSDLAAIPVAKNGIAIYDKSAIRRLARGRWRWLTHHVVPALTGGRLRVHPWSAYAHYDEWLRRACPNFVRATLNQAQYLDDVFQMDRVHDLVGRHLSGQVNAFEKICVLMTFAIWRRGVGARVVVPLPTAVSLDAW